MQMRDLSSIRAIRDLAHASQTIIIPEPDFAKEVQLGFPRKGVLASFVPRSSARVGHQTRSPRTMNSFGMSSKRVKRLLNRIRVTSILLAMLTYGASISEGAA